MPRWQLPARLVGDAQRGDCAARAGLRRGLMPCAPRRPRGLPVEVRERGRIAASSGCSSANWRAPLLRAARASSRSVEKVLDPCGDLERVPCSQEQSVLAVDELVAEVAGGQDHRPAHGQELGQLRGQPVAVELVGRRPAGRRRRRAPGSPGPPARRTCPSSTMPSIRARKLRGSTPPARGSEADQLHRPAAALEQLHRDVEAEQLVLVREMPDAVIDEDEIVGTQAELLARDARLEVRPEALVVDAWPRDPIRASAEVELVQLLGDPRDPARRRSSSRG